MIKCPRCGFHNQNNDKYCIYCGFKLISNLDNASDKTVIKQKNMVISILLAIFLPGISYFYIEQWYSGILFLLLIPLIFISYSVIAAFYSTTYNISSEIGVYLVMLTWLVLYIFQIYKVIKLTKLINQGIIRF